MAYQEINVSSYIGVMSPQALSLAVNGGGAAITTHATARFDVGVTKAAMPEGLARLTVRADGVYGSAEDLAVSLRHQLAYYLLLSLEFLIAADILDTIVQPSLEELAVLGGILAIRTVISFSLSWEMRSESD